jgi:S-adenosylmethionine:tRNA ribosyltransferase-isomerase
MGVTPLPKYIRRPMDEDTMAQYEEIFGDLPVDEMDEERYQTVFAKNIGAVAAPAAGMHFSKNLLKRLEIRGVETYTLTSHVGLGNFKSVDVEDLSKHKVESEQISIPNELVQVVDKAHASGSRVCAVGTEVMRALEHVVGTSGQIKAYDGWTNKFIYPPYDFTVANAFFVNFYMPQSSQLMMVAAFGGHDKVMNAYNQAVKEGYRFGDYGDAMLILND